MFPESLKQDNNVRKREVRYQQSLLAIVTYDSHHIRVNYIGEGHPKTKELSAAWVDIIVDDSMLTYDDLRGYEHVFDAIRLKEVWIKSTQKDSHEKLRWINRACSTTEYKNCGKYVDLYFRTLFPLDHRLYHTNI